MMKDFRRFRFKAYTVKILSIVLLFLIAMTACSNLESSGQIESSLIYICQEELAKVPISVSVVKAEKVNENTFDFYYDNESQKSKTITLPEFHIMNSFERDETMAIKETQKLNSEEKSIISSARKKMIEAIERSDILADKGNLKLKIISVPFKKAKMDNVIDGALCKDSTIYISDKWLITEKLIIHNLIHYVRRLTGSTTYYGCDFEESLTEILTQRVLCEDSALAEGLSEIDSNGNEFVKYALGNFGGDLLRLYFYGDEEIYNKLSREDLEFYFKAIDIAENYPEIKGILQNYSSAWASKMMQP